MPKLDQAFLKEAMDRFRKLPPDAQPAWGQLNGTTVIHHLLWAANYSLGKHDEDPFNGNWFFTNIIGPLAVNGWLTLPKNVKFKTDTGTVKTDLFDEGDVDALEAAMREFIEKEAAGGLKSPRHSFFGDIGAEGWSKLHVVHLKHHLNQFGI